VNNAATFIEGVALNDRPVCVAAEAPAFSKKLESADVFEGTVVKLECDVTGFPQPQITWYQVRLLPTSSTLLNLRPIVVFDGAWSLDAAYPNAKSLLGAQLRHGHKTVRTRRMNEL